MQPRLEAVWEAEWEAAGDVAHGEDTEGSDTDDGGGVGDASRNRRTNARLVRYFRGAALAEARNRQRRALAAAENRWDAEDSCVFSETSFVMVVAAALLWLGSLSASGAALALLIAATVTLSLEWPKPVRARAM